MASIFYRFKSSKDLHSLPIDGRFVSVSDFKAEIFASKFYGNGNDFDLLITDSKTEEHYTDASSLIPAYSSLLIRRVPGTHRPPIVIAEEKPKIQNNPSSSVVVKDSVHEEEGFDSHDFGPDFSSIPENSTLNPSNTHCKEEKIDGVFKFLAVKGFGKGQFKVPPQGYVCHRCKVAGHYIQHCPTNGDPNFDFKRVKSDKTLISKDSASSSTGSGISKAASGSSSCSSVITIASASTSSGSVGENIPPELYCPLCKQVLKDAALTKCCFASFCVECIRGHIVSKSVCVCQRKIMADDVLPNMTLRGTITRILKLNRHGDTSSVNAGSEAANLKRKLDSDVAEQSMKKLRVG
ncbi:hypothetical protein PTKIN_Ptkin14bG0208800 [Pterospermum kingtungense]